MKIGSIVAEFIGTFTLVFVGVLAIHHLGAVPGGLVGIALAHGLAIAVMVSATGAVSGGHLNPAVTLGLLTAGKIDLKSAAGYIVSQCLAGLAAALLLSRFLPAAAIAGGTPALAGGVSAVHGVVLELVATFFLVFVVYGTAVDGRAPKVGGLFIGLAVTLGILAIGPLTGGAMNPARHLGTALVGGRAAQISQGWIYWAGPVAGGVLAAQVFRRLLERREDTPRS